MHLGGRELALNVHGIRFDPQHSAEIYCNLTTATVFSLEADFGTGMVPNAFPILPNGILTNQDNGRGERIIKRNTH